MSPNTPLRYTAISGFLAPSIHTAYQIGKRRMEENMSNRYPRDMRGYGQTPPEANWPGGAKIAVQIVVNYEEGGENNTLHGDAASEAFLSEIVGAAQWPGQRHWNMESIYEYGSRSGFWRLHRLFTGFDVPVTVFGVASALARSPEQVAAMIAADWEIASHGLKWVEYKDCPEDVEREHLTEAIRLHTEVPGKAPQWRGGGLMVQRIAGDSARKSTDDEWDNAKAVMSTLSAAEILDPDLSSENLLYRLFHEMGVGRAAPQTLAAKCSCSRDRLLATLKTFDKAAQDEMMEDGKISANCEFCAKDYIFTPDDLNV